MGNSSTKRHISISTLPRIFGSFGLQLALRDAKKYVLSNLMTICFNA